ncbi:MAG: F0F1 ATP synthase subunit B [Planctomycetes bacterium]|nr:F0F1 ATP synthase subunit B [Planctomycetota bacterium]
MNWRSLILVLCVLPILACRLLAQEEHVVEQPVQEAGIHAETVDTGHGEGGSEPNIFAGDWGNVILTLSIFIVLLVVLRKWAWGPILTGLQKREDHIRQSIEEAEKARADGEKALSEYKEKLAEAQQEAQGIIDKGRADAVALAGEMKQKAKDEAQHLRTQAACDISSAKDAALKEMYDQSVHLAADIAGRIISKELNAEDHRELLQESLNKLQE